MDKSLPSHFSGILTDLEYQILLGYVFEYFRKKEIPIKDLKDGVLFIEDSRLGGGAGQLALDNVIRSCKGGEETNWKMLITEHFNRLLNEGFNIEDIVYDFKKVKEVLIVRLYGRGIMAEEGSEDNFVWRMDMEGVYTILALNLPTRFQTVTRKDADLWGIDDDKLFEMALHNANQQKVDVLRAKKEGAELMAFFSNDYSATYLLDLENNCPDAIGTFGTILSLPTKGTAFAHPINSTREPIFVAFSTIARQTMHIYQQDPWAITSNIYWYYEGQYYRFPTYSKNEKVAFSFPQMLEEMLGKY